MAEKDFDPLNGFTIALQDGELFDFRPVKPDDWQTIQKGMGALSSKSRYFRFFSPLTKLSDTQLHYFTEVDQCEHVAWIALARDLAGYPGVGIARFIRFKDEPHIAEFAVTVIDEYQKRGLGTLLLAVLYLLARKQGIQLLRAYVLPENRVAMTWFEGLGSSSKFENGLLQMDIAVYSDQASSINSPLLQYFKAYLPRLTPLLDQNKS